MNLLEKELIAVLASCSYRDRLIKNALCVKLASSLLPERLTAMLDAGISGDVSALKAERSKLGYELTTNSVKANDSLIADAESLAIQGVYVLCFLKSEQFYGFASPALYAACALSTPKPNYTNSALRCDAIRKMLTKIET